MEESHESPFIEERVKGNTELWLEEKGILNSDLLFFVLVNIFKVQHSFCERKI